MIDEPNRQAFAQMMRDLLKSIVDVRNHITHQGRHVLEEELRAFAAVTADLAGRVIVSKEGEPFRPSAEVGEIASKIGCELRTMGLGLFSFLQRLNDEMAKRIAEGESG